MSLPKSEAQKLWFRCVGTQAPSTPTATDLESTWRKFLTDVTLESACALARAELIAADWVPGFDGGMLRQTATLGGQVTIISQKTRLDLGLVAERLPAASRKNKNRLAKRKGSAAPQPVRPKAKSARKAAPSRKVRR